MSVAFPSFVQGNSRPFFAVQLLNSNDRSPIVLTGATVAFYFRQRNDSKVIVNGAACNITDAANGKVEYRWAATDLRTPGVYIAEFRITFADATVQSVIIQDITVLEKLG